MNAPLYFAVLLLCATPVLTAQSHPLPSEMVAAFGPEHTWAEEMYLPVANPGAFIRARLTFENSSSTVKRVEIDWWFQAAGALPRSSHESFDVSYKPTAIARRAGTSSTFYVVGWAERTGQVIVESWTMPAAYLLGSATPQGGLQALSTFSHSPFIREVEWTSPSGTMEPVWDAACQPFSNELLLLPRGTPTRIVALNLSTRTLTELYNSTNLPVLAGHRTLAIGRNVLAGMVAISSRRKQWEHGMKLGPTDIEFLMYDSNSDGVFESTGVAQVDSLYVVLPGDWDNRYQE
ncbi:MAG TPA: hypothetical protein VFY71_06145 [Planctomycetota bacterium]|nr:hypothetical protein [Planctomycetota bacterium]